MSEYLLSNSFSLFARLIVPILVGVGVGGIISVLLQLLLHVEDKALSFLCRYLGGAVGIYLALSLSAQTITRYAERLWGGIDFYR